MTEIKPVFSPGRKTITRQQNELQDGYFITQGAKYHLADRTFE